MALSNRRSSFRYRRLSPISVTPWDTIGDERMKWIELGQICIGHAEAEHVRIEVVSQESDDWRVANVEVAVGIWKGLFRWQFYNGDLLTRGALSAALSVSVS